MFSLKQRLTPQNVVITRMGSRDHHLGGGWGEGASILVREIILYGKQKKIESMTLEYFKRRCSGVKALEAVCYTCRRFAAESR